MATLPPMSAGDAFMLGRSPDCDVIVDEETVIKRHARIDWRASEATLEELGSANGVFLNSVRLGGKRVVADNHLLALGAVHMFFMHVATLRRRIEDLAFVASSARSDEEFGRFLHLRKAARKGDPDLGGDVGAR